MTQRFPRVVAAIAFLIGLVGLAVSLPLLSGIKTSLFFLLGATVWAFLLWRATCPDFRRAFLTGWIWSCLLHLGLLPLSIFLPAILGTELPITLFILAMFVLSFVGLFSDLRLSSQVEPGDPAKSDWRVDGEGADEHLLPAQDKEKGRSVPSGKMDAHFS